MDIIKTNDQGKELWRYPAKVLAQTEMEIRFEAFFNRDDYDAGYVVYKREDRFVETFYRDRWYNVFAIYDKDDESFKGWYCNITRPATWDDKELRADDLALDVWVFPDGEREPLVLDQEEFVELGLKPAESASALQALDEILELAAKGKLPR